MGAHRHLLALVIAFEQVALSYVFAEGHRCAFSLCLVFTSVWLA